MAEAELRRRYSVGGLVQGVGFRPFVYRLARELGLSGSVRNTAAGAAIEVEGSHEAMSAFAMRLPSDLPPAARILLMETTDLAPAGLTGFTIEASTRDAAPSASVLPDLATCAECSAEIADRAERRYRYPFTNCTNCGPRFTIVLRLPYDRANTTMSGFAMCHTCRAEYEDPTDRRFHAQPIACPRCGPQVALWEPDGSEAAAGDDAIAGAVEALRRGLVVAVKGLGGFHLMCDATSCAAIGRLRSAKRRGEKPLALMVRHLADANALADIDATEAAALTSPVSPIVLLRARKPSPISPLVAPGNPYLGVMLAYTPLHIILTGDFCGPLVATSGNRIDEPICTDERGALDRLSGLADLFLVHNRPIARHVDDSIMAVMSAREIVMRRSRGLAPLPVPMPSLSRATLAVGAHLKNAIALGASGMAYTGQHIGDLDTPESMRAFRRSVADLPALYEQQIETVACDLHPDYASTRYAEAMSGELAPVQHHHAHVLSCMAENDLRGDVLGFAWDGAGMGLDGTAWGGEALVASEKAFARFAALRPFPLPGADTAARRPWRSALGLLVAAVGLDGACSAMSALRHGLDARQLRIVAARAAAGAGSPLTSAMGRLFDGVSFLAGGRSAAHFEGQAAMEFEWAADRSATGHYDLPLEHDGPVRWIDWRPLLAAVQDDRASGVPLGIISMRFHRALADMAARVVVAAGLRRVAVSGGCFQNRLLLELVIAAVEAEGATVYTQRHVPPNDGGIALGQLYAVAGRTVDPSH
ncbi:MAG: carbamoyltransferase HypF [Armatimonadetes bacterium]|nr:carbamoyltransferase HypF [Armatimonadota bacterium]